MKLLFIQALPEIGDYSHANIEFNSLFSVGTVFKALKTKEGTLGVIDDPIIYRLSMRAPDKASSPLFGNYPIYESERAHFKELR